VSWQAFTQDEFEAKLVDFIILSNQPFTIVENESFKNLILLCNPNAKFVSDATIKRRVVQRFEEEKIKLRQMLLVSCKLN